MGMWSENSNVSFSAKHLLIYAVAGSALITGSTFACYVFILFFMFVIDAQHEHVTSQSSTPLMEKNTAALRSSLFSIDVCIVRHPSHLLRQSSCWLVDLHHHQWCQYTRLHDIYHMHMRLKRLHLPSWVMTCWCNHGHSIWDAATSDALFLTSKQRAYICNYSFPSELSQREHQQAVVHLVSLASWVPLAATCREDQQLWLFCLKIFSGKCCLWDCGYLLLQFAGWDEWMSQMAG